MIRETNSFMVKVEDLHFVLGIGGDGESWVSDLEGGEGTIVFCFTIRYSFLIWNVYYNWVEGVTVTINVYC